MKPGECHRILLSAFSVYLKKGAFFFFLPNLKSFFSRFFVLPLLSLCWWSWLSIFLKSSLRMNENSSQLESFWRLLFLLGVPETPQLTACLSSFLFLALVKCYRETVRQRSWEKVCKLTLI